jgi:hypothetical protein
MFPQKEINEELVSFRITADQKLMLERLAKRNQMSISHYLRCLIIQDASKTTGD